MNTDLSDSASLEQKAAQVQFHPRVFFKYIGATEPVLNLSYSKFNNSSERDQFVVHLVEGMNSKMLLQITP